MKKVLFSLTLVASLVISSIALQPVQALSGSEFNAGRIMDDSVFFHGQSIGTDTIQAFLNSKVPICDTNGTQVHSSGQSRASYGTSRGYPPPYTCLKDFRQDTPNKGADAYCGAYSGGNKSAAQIIYDVGAACGVSQKALIVLLEKEQSLITDNWPWSVQYRSATGYGCPDTAPCDSEYYGFFNQVYNAARQFKRYSINSTSFRYRAYRDNYIQYNPNTACGGSNVFLQNQATAGLYNYTPYQPNASALNNLYGSGDSCGAYGNRNFWRLYRDWFGGTFTQSYSWQPEGVYEIFDESNTTRVDPGFLKPGARYFVKISAKNTGSATWTKDGYNPVLLGTYNPDNHASPFCDYTWPSCSRPAGLIESTVNPGEVGHFHFYIKAPYGPGDYKEYFKPLAEMLSWMNAVPDKPFGVRVVSGSFSWRPAGPYEIFDESNTLRVDPGLLKPGYKYTAKVAAINTGSATWEKSGPTPLMLATAQPTGRNSVLCDPSWPSCSRPAGLIEPYVEPGQIGHFQFKFQAPYTNGTFVEGIKPVAEMLSWTNDVPEQFGVKTNSGSYSWELVNGLYEIYDQSGNARVDPGFLAPNTKYLVKLKAKNIGSATWEKSGPTPFTLATTKPENHSSILCDITWPACSRPTYIQESAVLPGQIGNFQFLIQTPTTPGTYQEHFKPVAEMLSWTNETPHTFGIRVVQ